MRPCSVKGAWGVALALANSEGLEERQKQGRAILRSWTSTRDFRAELSRVRCRP
jgi:hypothetical protein